MLGCVGVGFEGCGLWWVVGGTVWIEVGLGEGVGGCGCVVGGGVGKCGVRLV